MKNIGQIIEDYLIKNGYSGLYCDDGDCVCNMDDLFCCGEDCTGCNPGYEIEDKTGEYKYMISSKKLDIDK